MHRFPIPLSPAGHPRPARRGSGPGEAVGAPALAGRMTFVAAALVAATLLVGCVASEAGRSPKRTPSSAPTATPASSAPSTVSPLPRVAAGLPPGLGGRAWTAITASGRWIGGRFGRPGRLELPEGDLPLATADDVIATSQATADDASTIRVRDLGTGRLVAEVRRPEHIVSGVILGDRLVASGYDPANESSDPGLIAIGVADGSVAMLMSPAGLPNGWTGAAHRSVIASPTGRTLVSAVCLMDRCSIDVVDPTTGTWRNVVPDIAAFPRVTTDDVLIVGPDGYVDEIDAFDISTGQRLWTKRDAEFQVGYLTSDGRLVQPYIDHRGPIQFVVAVVDARTGVERVIRRSDPNDDLTLWPEVSTDDVVVLGSGGRFQDAAGASPVIRGIAVDLATGRLEPGSLAIPVDQ